MYIEIGANPPFANAIRREAVKHGMSVEGVVSSIFEAWFNAEGYDGTTLSRQMASNCQPDTWEDHNMRTGLILSCTSEHLPLSGRRANDVEAKMYHVMASTYHFRDTTAGDLVWVAETDYQTGDEVLRSYVGYITDDPFTPKEVHESEDAVYKCIITDDGEVYNINADSRIAFLTRQKG